MSISCKKNHQISDDLSYLVDALVSEDRINSFDKRPGPDFGEFLQFFQKMMQVRKL